MADADDAQRSLAESGGEQTPEQTPEPAAVQDPRAGASAPGRARLHRTTFPVEWRGLKLRQKRVLAALVRALGVVQTACALCNTARKTFYAWYRSNELFRRCADDIRWSAIGKVELKLTEAVMKGNVAAITFYLKNRAPEQWGERTQVDATVRAERTGLDMLSDEELDRVYAVAREGRSADDSNSVVPQSEGAAGRACGPHGSLGPAAALSPPDESDERVGDGGGAPREADLMEQMHADGEEK